MAKPLITLHSKIQRNSNIVSSHIDGEVVMMSIENGEYYGLDEVGSMIWKLIESPITVEELIRLLMEEFEVEQADCENDTFEFLNDLYDKKLLAIFT